MGKMQKAKGASFERQVCRDLSLWVSGGKHKDLFWRASMSGGRATMAARIKPGARYKRGSRLKAQAGDISSVHPDGHPLTSQFFIECKHVKDLCIDSFLFNGTGPLAHYWREASKAASDHDKEPLLIARQNNFPTLAITTEYGARLLFQDRYGNTITRVAMLGMDAELALYATMLKGKFDLK